VTAAPAPATDVADLLRAAARHPSPPAVLRLAIGDRAVNVVVDAPAGAIERWRIEHADDERLATLREIDRLAVLVALALAIARRASA
jgi:predicted amidohydrolase YtcJ